MKRILQSKIAAWCAFLLIVMLLVATFSLRPVWWVFFDIFFFFMMAFCHLLSVSIYKANRFISTKLDYIAAIMGVMGIIALVAEYFLFQASL